MRMKSSCRSMAVCLSLMLGACGGGSGGGTPTATAVQYTSAAAVGEVLDYTLDTTKLTYAYTIKESQFGLDGVSGSGVLVDNGDGTYSPEGTPGAKIFPVQNGMLVGAVKLSIGGTDRVIPLIGFSNPVNSIADLQGTYNYVERVCATAGLQCGSTYGTFQITSGGNWTNCDQADVSSTCTGHKQTSGTLNALDGGRWQVLAQNGAEIGTGLAFKASSGQNVWVIDLHRAIPDGGVGIGLLIGSAQNAVSTADTNGTWIFAGTTGAIQYGGELVAQGESYTASGILLSGKGVLPFAGSAVGFTHNKPWNGFVQTANSGVALLAGTGMYASTDTAVGSLQIGLRK